jgi:hypothetical protein
VNSQGRQPMEEGANEWEPWKGETFLWVRLSPLRGLPYLLPRSRGGHRPVGWSPWLMTATPTGA